MPMAALQLNDILDPMPGAAGALLTDATDCDFRPTASAARDGAALAQAGIGRIVVDVAHWPKLLETGWRGAVRGIVDHSMLSDGDLQHLNARGVRAVRVRLDTPSDADALPALADRIVKLGWHIEIAARLRADAALLAPVEWALAQMPVALCFADRSGYDPRLSLDHPDIAFILELVRVGRGWLKLTDAVPSPNVKAFVEALLACRSDRIVWGSGVRRDPMRAMATGLEDLVCGAAERQSILSQNPARLYGFHDE